MPKTLNSSLSSQQPKQENITISEYQLELNQKKEKLGPKFTEREAWFFDEYKNLSTSRKGRIGEMYVQIVAWERGIECLMNDDCKGPVDLILYDPNRLPNTVLVDVKSTSKKTHGDRYGQGQKARPRLDGIYTVSYHPLTRKVRWLEGLEPSEDWKNFWPENETIN